MENSNYFPIHFYLFIFFIEFSGKDSTQTEANQGSKGKEPHYFAAESVVDSSKQCGVDLKISTASNDDCNHKFQLQETTITNKNLCGDISAPLGATKIAAQLLQKCLICKYRSSQGGEMVEHGYLFSLTLAIYYKSFPEKICRKC